jgi:leucyl-tRNA synthetase
MFFTAPSEKEVLWSSDSITGVEKFVLNRMMPIVKDYRGSRFDLKRYFKLESLDEYERSIYVKLNQTVKRVAESYDRLQFNAAIAAVMELTRDYDSSKITNDELNDQIILKSVQMIAPMAPHIAEEIWEMAGFRQSIFKSGWPEHDPAAVVGDTIEIAVQVNGKLRDSIVVPAGADQAQVETAAMESSKVRGFTDGKEILKKIYVAGRLLNIVVKG